MTHEQIRRLKTLWEQRYPRRARGGLWALSGFAFQASRFLVCFFEGLDAGDRSPDTLAEMEGLSDILAHHDGRFLVVQAKRRLDRSTLKSALTDLYLVADLCRRDVPELLPLLRFQVVCREKAPDLDVRDVERHQVVPRKDDGAEVDEAEEAASWQALLDALDPAEPIVEAPDDRVRLHVYLWNQGVRNPRDLLERCLGRLLAAFDRSDTVDQVGYDLADFYAGAERRREWCGVGRVLSPADVEPIEASGKGPTVLIGARPRLEDLRRGRFRDRPLFADLWQAFRDWLADVESGLDASGKIPVFWISGRSGEGKSVLLLQLIAAVVRSQLSLPLVQLAGGRDVARLVTAASQRGAVPDGSSRLFGVVDDLYDVPDREAFVAEMRDACALAFPSVALVTCGPTEQMEQFSHDLKPEMRVTSLRVPILERRELEDFVAWYAELTGQEQRLDRMTTENTILVQLMFELAQGRSLPEFARRFRSRLEHSGIFDEARRILAANALYVDAPLALLDDDEKRDALERLSAEDQLHFQIVEKNADGEPFAVVRLAHPHLAWLLFTEWVRPPLTLGKAWARDLVETLEIYLASSLSRRGHGLLYLLLKTTRLTDEPAETTAGRQETLAELYRLHVERHHGRPKVETLSSWLEHLLRLPGLDLSPDPCFVAGEVMKDDDLARCLPRHTTVSLWTLAEKRGLENILKTTMQYLLRYSTSSGAGISVYLIYNLSSHQEASQLVGRWLNEKTKHPENYVLFESLVKSRPTDSGVVRRAKEWLDANAEHPQAYHVLAALVKSHSADPGVVRRAKEWSDANADRPQDYHFLAALVKSHSNDPGVVRRAKEWLDANTEHPQAYLLLAPLVKSRSNDPGVVRRAKEWLDENAEHPRAHYLLVPFVKALKNDPDAISRAKSWLAGHRDHPQAYQVAAQLRRAARLSPADASQLKKPGQPTPAKKAKIPALKGSLAYAFEKARRDQQD